MRHCLNAIEARDDEYGKAQEECQALFSEGSRGFEWRLAEYTSSFFVPKSRTREGNSTCREVLFPTEEPHATKRGPL
jgi:hypothetical protein